MLQNTKNIALRSLKILYIFVLRAGKVTIFAAMDHSPFEQTFKLGTFISTAGKSILNLVKLRSLVAKHCKMSKT